MQFAYILLALAAGACLPSQAGINAQLARFTRDPASAALISFSVGTLTLLAYCLVSRVPMPPLGQAGQTSPWLWIGGALGALVVTSGILLAPRLGAATYMALLVAGQLLASLVLDHHGWLGYEIRSASLPRLLGALLLIIGVVLIRKF